MDQKITFIAFNFLIKCFQVYCMLYLGSGGSRISVGGGGVDLVAGGVDSRGSYVSKILYVKTKELGPLGGCMPGALV